MATKKKAAAAKKFTKLNDSDEEYGTFGRKGTSLTGQWLQLATAYGGVAQLARHIGISTSTLYRWAVKQDPVMGSWRAVVILLASAKGLEPPPMAFEEPSKK